MQRGVRAANVSPYRRPPVHFQRPYDPLVSFRNSQGDAARGTLTSVQRRALVMEIYNPYSIVQVSEVLSELTIRSGTRPIYQGKAVVVGMLNTGLMAVVSLTLIDEWNDLGGVGNDAQSVSGAVHEFLKDWNTRTVVRPAYQAVVNELRGYFSEVTRWLDQADLAAGLPRDESGRVRADVFMELARPLLEHGQAYLRQFELEAAAIPPDEEIAHRAFAQAAIHPLVLRAPFVYRTYAKPLGYAGDYRMVTQILGDPREGPSTYFELVNFMFLQAAVAQAHRNRVDMLCDWLCAAAGQARREARALRVLNVGCGPAAEIERAIRRGEDLSHVHIDLVDFSEETLDHARARLSLAARETGVAPPGLRARHESVHQLLKRSVRAAEVPAEERFDLIYCAGLFDYLADKACTRLIEYFAQHLRPLGRLLVTNVHQNNPERHWMEHFMEWYLIYRDESGMQRLFPATAVPERTYTDATGVNLFVEAVRPA